MDAPDDFRHRHGNLGRRIDDTGYSVPTVWTCGSDGPFHQCPRRASAASDRAADGHSLCAHDGCQAHTPLDPVLSLALGSSPVSPLEMASVYSTFAAGGNHPEPSAWTRLTDAQDNVIEDVPPAIETHVLQKDTVAQLDDMLRAVVDRAAAAPAIWSSSMSRTRAAKRARRRSIKMSGLSATPPDLVCAVWAGHPIYKSKNLQAGLWRGDGKQCLRRHDLRPDLGQVHEPGACPIFQTAKAKELAREKPSSPGRQARHQRGHGATADHLGTPSDTSSDPPADSIADIARARRAAARQRRRHGDRHRGRQHRPARARRLHQLAPGDVHGGDGADDAVAAVYGQPGQRQRQQ